MCQNRAGSFLIFMAASLRLIICMFLADGHGEACVKLSIVELLCAVRARKFVSTSLLSDDELRVQTLCQGYP